MREKKISRWEQERNEKREELKKVKSVLLKIIEHEKVEAIDKLKAVELIVDIDKALSKL